MISLFPYLTSSVNHTVISGTTATVIISISVLIICVLLIAGCTCSKSNRQDDQDMGSDNGDVENERKELKANLIPPLFFTQGLKDPLQQDDLLEKVKQDGVTE
ncbi:hypothetical protein TVAG_391350 [Trichomonas vaginalis G3]|uniref:Uncharacterized protein n=1 Tax=Trichomonas vaginalis (strain ATCC PRA-98 / G3) TaxID=412133 RepID=A2DFP8_TRIV3|nr:hypothetical protein TVAGG3_0323530 [Trichomonas vaginalis G3]EAY20751.1 hypothetical protein TVAG_391350 [Trichomonas vaginalis G3]KAI5529469.1 hypothetical protein TVAGG3_0323530 [Trichomonas vaginalis G3]|eukprot:XP_001581737.1 hypothetical protein [Trichomonas vaginalis G3]